MKKLILSAIIIFSCENSTEPTDYKGVSDGNAVIDGFGICGGKVLNDKGYK